MKSKIFIMLGIMLCLGGTVLTAAGLEPGSSNDPLVTKSYVDSLFSSLKNEEDEKDNDKNKEEVTQSAGNIFEVIELDEGQTLLGHAGCEMILRSGKATVNSYISEEGIENGLQDITDGIDLKNGENVPLNHLILIPRTDTRGMTTITDEVFVMVRGSYEIK